MGKLLITGFEPFGGEKVNPSWEAVKLLPDVLGDWELKKLEVPVVYGEGADVVWAAAEAFKPDVILCVGQAGGRSSIAVERVAINLRESAGPDNSGRVCRDEPVAADGPAAYFATLPVKAMADAIRAADIPAVLSYSAGSYVCNDLMYSMLHRCSGSGVRAGFIHIPFMTSQSNGNVPALPLEVMANALKAAVLAIK